MSPTPLPQIGGSGERDLRGRVDAALRAFLDAQAPAWLQVGAPLAFTELRRSVLAGGKRLRPALCYWGWRAAGGDDEPPVITAAASLELFHAALLIHDDVMDRSELRRGQPTLHRALAAAHAHGGWRGEPDWFGVSVAVDCGDTLLMWADEMYRGCGLGWPQLRAGYEQLSRMRTEVFTGQFLDIDEQARGGSVAGALRVISHKTAGYTVAGPLRLGAALAGAGTRLLAALDQVGRPLGEAFQLRDDLLGVFGDPAVTGKPNVDDLREGKQTVLVALTRAAATPRQARLFDALHGSPDLAEAQAATLREIITATGADIQVENMISERARAARRALAQAPVTAEAARVLGRLIISLAQRQA